MTTPNLFLGEQDVGERRHVELNVCEATRRPAPVLPLGRADEWDAVQAMPWAGRTVLYDDDEKRFKCWYTGTDLSDRKWWASGYAISEDGIHWTKPRLGLIDYRGSKDNNIVRPGWGAVIRDPDDPDASRRYKAILMGPMPHREHGLRPAWSPDGIHWTEGERFTIPGSQKDVPDVVAFVRDEHEADPDRRYRLVWQETRPSSKPGPGIVRVKCMGFSPDGLRFTPSAANPILDPNDSVEQENHFLMLAPRGGRWLMPYEYGWYCPNGLGNFGQYMADVRLAVSEDGERFRRLNPHQKLIDRGAPGQWDDTILVVADKPVIASDTVHLFYAGAGAQWTCWASNNQPESLAHNVGANCVGRMGLATLRRDGWTCLETADGASFGSATSKEIEASERGSALKLNLSRAMPQRSFVTVEVIDAATGQVIKGLDRASCRPLDRDDLDATVTWRGRSLADAPARPIRLRFHFCGAVRLHAFAIEQ